MTWTGEVAARGCTKLFDFTGQAFNAELRVVCNLLRINPPFLAYAARHGGASDDAAVAVQSFDDLAVCVRELRGKKKELYVLIIARALAELNYPGN